MPIESASAALTATVQQQTVVGFFNYRQGILDINTGAIKPQSRGSWSQLSGKKWSSWQNFQLETTTIQWTSERIDRGQVEYFNLNIESDFDGECSYIIYVSETGDFAGEESEYYVQDGDYNVSAFYGRYAYVTARVIGREFRSMTITASNTKSTFYLSNIDTSTLGGTTAARTLSPNLPISAIIDMQIQPKTATTYNVNLYVSDTATSTALIPMVISKSMPSPSFVMRGIDNDPRDGIVDIVITGLPRQVMTGGNLIVIA